MEGVFRRLRDLMLSGGRYTRVVSDELIRLYEIQQALRALRWLDLRGRMRLGLQLTRVVVSVCVALPPTPLRPFLPERRESTHG